MALPVARQRLAQSIARRGRREVQRNNRNHQLAKVTSVSPLKADLFDSKLSLDENDLGITGWIRQYHSVFGIAAGDTLVLHRVSGHWVIHDVLEDGTRRLDEYVPGSMD